MLLAYQPHAYCLLKQQGLIWIFAGSDVTIALSYFVIAFLLVYQLSLTQIKLSPWVKVIVAGFASFILACGVTHVFDVVDLWHPLYPSHAVFEAATALISSSVAIVFGTVIRQGLGYVESSIYDPSISNLYNRRFAEYDLEREKNRSDRSKLPLSMLLIDCDKFKEINDTYGHQAGDRVLQAVADVITKIRDYDGAARVGGDEFLVWLPEMDKDAAIVRAEGMRAEISALAVKSPRGEAVKVTVTIGIACYPLHGDSIEAVYAAADRALYQAKERGRDRVCVAE